MKLYKCEICKLIFEDVKLDECPKCKQKTVRVIATYPAVKDSDEKVQIES